MERSDYLAAWFGGGVRRAASLDMRRSGAVERHELDCIDVVDHALGRGRLPGIGQRALLLRIEQPVLLLELRGGAGRGGGDLGGEHIEPVQELLDEVLALETSADSTCVDN